MGLEKFDWGGTEPDTITRIDFQMFAEEGDEAPYLYYLDQFGLLE